MSNSENAEKIGIIFFQYRLLLGLLSQFGWKTSRWMSFLKALRSVVNIPDFHDSMESTPPPPTLPKNSRKRELESNWGNWRGSISSMPGYTPFIESHSNVKDPSAISLSVIQISTGSLKLSKTKKIKNLWYTVCLWWAPSFIDFFSFSR